MKNKLLILLVLALSFAPLNQVLAAAAAQTSPPLVEEDFIEDPFAAEDVIIPEVYDPLEPVNRGMFWVNDKLYFYLFKPVAKGLRLAPEPVRVSVSNFFSNLGTPVRFANCLLQFKLKDAGTELGRFLVNTLLGFGGFFDSAGYNGMEKKSEDLGQTFGHYGLGSGPYLVLPLLGPSNLRDGLGLIGDRFIDPLPYYLKESEILALRIIDVENELSLDKDTYEGIKKLELDPYLFIQNAYQQRRAAMINK